MKKRTVAFILLGLSLAIAVTAHIHCNANKCKAIGKFDGVVDLVDVDGNVIIDVSIKDLSSGKLLAFSKYKTNKTQEEVETYTRK